MGNHHHHEALNSSFSFSSSIGESNGESREAYIISITDADPHINRVPSLQIILLNSITNTCSRQDLAKNILSFTLSVAVALLSQIQVPLPSKLPLENFIFFLLLAFSASLAAICSRREQSNATAFFHCVAILAMSLAFASVASVFLRVWFRAVAYGICVLPLYALAPRRFERWFGKLVKVWRWRESESEDAVQVERGPGASV